MAGIKLNSIKTRVRIFFLFNIICVIGSYFFTVTYNRQSESDTKLLDVSKENDNFIERLGYITKAVVVGNEEELKPILRKEINNFEDNLLALKEGGDAIVNSGREKIEIPAITDRGEEELEDLRSTWRELQEHLLVIMRRPAEIDTSYTYAAEGEGTEELYLYEAEDDSIGQSAPVPGPTDTSTQVPASFPEEENPDIAPDLANLTPLEIIGNLTITNPEVEKAYFTAQTTLDEALSKSRQLSQVLEDNLTDSQSFLRAILFFTFLINVFILVFGFFYIGTYLVNPLKDISSTAKDVASGDISTQVNYHRKDEIGEVAGSLNLIVNSFKQYTEFAENIGKGNFKSDFEVKSDKDTLGYTLLHMRDSLRHVAEEDKKRNWANEGFALFSNILRTTDKDIEDFSYDIISNLVKYIDANQGGLFLLVEKDHEHYLEMQAAFAYNKRKYEEKRIPVGQGLLGQVALEKEIIYLDKVPNEYIQITSGLGKSNPRSILIAPLKVNDEVYGAIEIASFDYLEKYEKDFIEKLCENIASTMSSVKINENTKLLLDETRQYAEQMQAQEEEMRQNMEELAATQEEMEKNQKKLEEYKENLEKEVEKTHRSTQRKRSRLIQYLVSA
ncbi:MAG: GAF domain-containing protein [Bacteroidia bacterium]|nr:GAF domain-containing protein [Bacteroidia bacterium]